MMITVELVALVGAQITIFVGFMLRLERRLTKIETELGIGK